MDVSCHSRCGTQKNPPRLNGHWCRVYVEIWSPVTSSCQQNILERDVKQQINKQANQTVLHFLQRMEWVRQPYSFNEFRSLLFQRAWGVDYRQLILLIWERTTSRCNAQEYMFSFGKNHTHKVSVLWSSKHDTNIINYISVLY